MWPTPTPFPTASAPIQLPFSPDQVIGDFTGNVMQGWNLFNNSDVATIFFIGCLLLIIFVGLMSIRAHMENL